MNPQTETADGRSRLEAVDGRLSLMDLILPLLENFKKLIVLPLLAAALGVAASYAIKPSYTARTSFMPPQQAQSSAAAALASLGSLAGIAGGASARAPADQYVALLQSSTLTDRLIERFGLMAVYGETLRMDARRVLADSARFAVGKRDGLLSIEVDDADPKRAADLANAYVEELRRMTATLAVTEAQQRRVFFEQQMQQTREQLTKAQLALQSSGFNQGALRAEPRAAAEAYAALRATTTTAEIKLQTLRSTFASAAPEVVAQLSVVNALRAQLSKSEQASASEPSGDYVGKYREFKYQETLFELFARQYELARVDEAREGVLIQVVDIAQPPEKKSKPRRAMAAMVAMLTTLIGLVLWFTLRAAWLRNAADPARAAQKARLKAVFKADQASQ